MVWYYGRYNWDIVETETGKPIFEGILPKSNVTKLALLTFLITASTCSGVHAANLNPAKPNVLILYYDDMGYGDMGANQPTDLKIPADSKYLNPAIPTITPCLDAFAEQSLRFTHGHSSDGVCTPSRYSLITGRYSWRTRLKQGVLYGYGSTLMDADRFTVGELFKKHGYTTAMVGKWHLGMQFHNSKGEKFIRNKKIRKPAILADNLIDFSKKVTDTPFHRGFDYWFGTPASLDMPPYVWLESNSKTSDVHFFFKGGVVKDGKVDFSQARIAQNSDLIEGKVEQCSTRSGVQDPTFIFADYLQIQAQKVADVIAARKVDSKPFMIYVPIPAPHTPHVVQPKFRNSAGFTYGDYVVQADYYTGIMLKALGDHNDPKSLAANTVVFITSDNGPENGASDSGLQNNHDANGPFAGRKRDNWEGGTRVPFMIRWPGKVKPGITNHACWQGDFIATMAEYLKYNLAEDEAPDTESFLPILLNKKMPTNRRAGFIEHSASGQFAVVDQNGEWKLLDGTGGGGNKKTLDADNMMVLEKGEVCGTPRQLFNLKNDSGERDNLLVDDPKNPNDNNDPTPEALAKEKELYLLLNKIRGNKTLGI